MKLLELQRQTGVAPDIAKDYQAEFQALEIAGNLALFCFGGRAAGAAMGNRDMAALMATNTQAERYQEARAAGADTKAALFGSAFVRRRGIRTHGGDAGAVASANRVWRSGTVGCARGDG